MLTKFLIVGMDLCPKTQTNGHYLDCVTSITKPWVLFGLCQNHKPDMCMYIWSVLFSQARARCTIWNSCSIQHWRVHKFGELLVTIVSSQKSLGLFTTANIYNALCQDVWIQFYGWKLWVKWWKKSSLSNIQHPQTNRWQKCCCIASMQTMCRPYKKK